MAPRLRRGATALALVAAVGMTLSGCIPLPPSASTDPNGQPPNGTPQTSTAPDGSIDFTPTGEEVAADLEPYYSQDVPWAPCDGFASYTCGTVQTPMDWFDAGNGESIEVSMAIRPADGEVWGSMLYNPGGPGGSGYSYVLQYAEYLVAPEVLEHYNLVGFDPRGVGQSTPISCYDDPQWLNDWLFEVPGETFDDPLSDESLQYQLEEGAAFGEACLEHTGPALEFMGTEQVASDMDLIRALLGEDQLNYLGVSYGTLIGATYADLFPENVGRFVLDAAISPDSTDGEGTIFQAGGFELALSNFVADCITQDSCPFEGDDVDGVMEEISTLLDDLDEDPIESSDGRQLGSSSMFTAIAANLYSESSWSTLQAVFADVYAGEADSAFASADSYYGVNPDGTFADNSYEVLVAVNCLDYPAVTDFDDIRDTAAEVQDAAPTLWPDFVGVSSCASWPFEATREPHEVTAPGANPIIVIGGLNDPATPYDWSVRLAEMLESGVLITVDAEGHSQYNLGNPCVDGPVNDYFLTGNAITDDIDC